MLIYSGLPKKFWAEVVVTACYLINRCPSYVITFKPPLDVLKGTNSSYEHLRIFGWLAYAHTTQDKLEPRAQRCVFLGYPEEVMGYKLWNFEGRKNIISRDTIFDEETMYWDLIKQGEKESCKFRSFREISVWDVASKRNWKSKRNKYRNWRRRRRSWREHALRTG